jgi:hypothetical protein
MTYWQFWQFWHRNCWFCHYYSRKVHWRFCRQLIRAYAIRISIEEMKAMRWHGRPSRVRICINQAYLIHQCGVLIDWLLWSGQYLCLPSFFTNSQHDLWMQVGTEMSNACRHRQEAQIRAWVDVWKDNGDYSCYYVKIVKRSIANDWLYLCLRWPMTAWER